ncbi:ADP-ribosylation factor protein 3, partial [Nowakowskiella sp. JEL0078]
MNFWDLGGQRDLQSLWEKYYGECHAILFVIDANDQDRLDEVQEAFGRMFFENMITNDSIEGVPVLMLANKQDVEGALGVHEIKETFNKIAVKLSARDSKVMSVSALTGDGVRDAVDWLYVRLQRNKINRPPIFRN